MSDEELAQKICDLLSRVSVIENELKNMRGMLEKHDSLVTVLFRSDGEFRNELKWINEFINTDIFQQKIREETKR